MTYRKKRKHLIQDEDTIIVHLGRKVSPEKLEEIAKYVAACMQAKYPIINNILQS